WHWQNAAGDNSIACTSSGLMMQQASGSSPEVDVTTIPGSYDPNYFNARVHVHFNSSSSSTYAGFVFHAPSSNSQCGGMRFQINSAGAWRIAEYFLSSSGACTTNSWVGSVSAAFDYDLLIYVEPSGATLAVNGRGVLSGGFVPTGGLTGLAVWDGAGTSTQVAFSAFDVADPRVTRSDQFVTLPA
ncbi:MAG: hypothetical protein ACXVCX_18310, partial [Ktedonobacterales bacterium]